jgi:SWI/SNF-related matrix-associated actin-dependent regulator of chromatin subfamily A member 5
MIDDRTEKEIKAYHNAFFKKYKQIKDWEKILKSIEKGEEKLQKIKETHELIKKKYGMHKNPYLTMTFEYSQPQKLFTEEEDRFIICTLHNVGYGNWFV